MPQSEGEGWGSPISDDWRKAKHSAYSVLYAILFIFTNFSGLNWDRSLCMQVCGKVIYLFKIFRHVSKVNLSLCPYFIRIINTGGSGQICQNEIRNLG